MSFHDPIVYHELPVIRKIIADETWLEGERRGRYVSPEDPVVRENVCTVVLTIGAQLRAEMEKERQCSPVDRAAVNSDRAA